MNVKLLTAALVCVVLSSLTTWYLCREQKVPILFSATLPNGMTFKGDIVDGRLHGEGELVGESGEKYKGVFVDGLLQGEGEYWDSAGNHYKGEFKDGVIQGQGVFTFVYGDRHEGSYEAGLFHGEGSLYTSSGEEYHGGFASGLFSGQGVYTVNEHTVYEGLFDKGKIVEGTQKAFESVYKGEFSNWLFHGKGIYTAPDGTIYEGVFNKGELHGEGRITAVDGALYEGEISAWLANGVGKNTEAGGDVYEGEFEYGMYSGEGELTLSQPLNDLTHVKGTWSWGKLKDDPRLPPPLDRSKTEALLYAQNSLLENGIQNLAEGTPSNIELFSVAVAGDGTQDVFLKEIQAIRPLLETSEYSAGRASYLVNHYQTAETWPLATQTALQKLLRGVASKMDLEEDIVFLYLTSHGSKDQELTVKMKGLSLAPISAENIAQALNESGIKWRVVVISACYSGGFIPALENENTLVLTAARDNRKSFGCGDDSEMTYFGKAFFSEALPQSATFVEAFTQAKERVAEWEARDFPEAKHSEPQMSAGKKIVKHLEKWRSQLD